MSKFNHFGSSMIKAIFRGAWPIIIFSILMAALSAYYAFNHLAMRTSRNDLVSSDQRLISLSEKIDRQFGSRDNMVVVVENTDPHRTINFAEVLATELRQYPRQFREIFYRVDPEKFKKWGLLYLDQQELSRLKEKLTEHRREMEAIAANPRLTRFFEVVNEEITRALVGHLFTGFLGEEPEKIPDLGLLQATLKQLHLSLTGSNTYSSPLNSIFPGEAADLSQEGYFLTENDKYLLFLVTSTEDGYTVTAEDLKLLRQVVDRVKTGFPGIQVGVTGPGALEADEMTEAMGDVELASWLSLVSQMLLMVLFFRSLKRTLVQGAVLFIGLCWTFGVAALAVGHLNLLSIVFGPLLLGITVDFGIHWYSRLEEEQGNNGRCKVEHIVCTIKQASPGILYAALTAMISVLPLVFTGFKGLAELGLIITLGILLHIFLSLGLLPSLAIVTERPKPEPLVGKCAGEPVPFLSLRGRWPGLIVAIGLGLTALGVISLFHVPFDLNPLHLQNPQTESVVWEMKLVKDSKYSTSYGTLVVSNLRDLPQLSKTLKKLDTVSHVESILSFLPAELAQKQRVLAELKPMIMAAKFPAAPASPSKAQELANVLGRMRFKLAEAEAGDWKPEDRNTKDQLSEVNHLILTLINLLNQPSELQAAARLAVFEQKFLTDLHDKWNLLQENVKWASHPPDIKDLPQEVRARFVSPQGNYLVRIFPSQDIWNLKPLKKFVQDLRTIDPNVVGDPVLLYVFTLAFRNACLWAAGASLLGISLMIFFLLRSLKLTLLALIPLLVGTALTFSLMWLLDIPFNQANVLFLPLILGEGIEYGIIILARWQMEESARAITLPASTAKGVLLAALTTALGFGSLMVSGHQGTFSLGLLSTVGSLSVLLAALSVLPAFLRLLREYYPESQADG